VTRVLLDATAVPANRGGVGRYIDGVLPGLAGVDLVVACQPRDAAGFAAAVPGATVIAVPGIERAARRFLWEQTGLPRLARRERVDVIHSPHYTMPLATRRPVVVSMYDATFFSDPAVHVPVKRHFFRFWIRRSGRRAARILVPSAATAGELTRFAGIPADRMRVAHLGVDAQTFHPVDAAARAEVAARIGHDAWIAFLGTLEPRKNLPALVRAHAALARVRADAGLTTPVLALAGGKGWETGLEAAIDETGSRDRVLLLGYLPVGELAAFLGGSVVTVYPSLGEGFGLPVLEAMACGAAVLTTPRLSLPEVGGDAVAYSEPDADALAAELGRLLDDPAERARLGAAALRRAAGFTWEATARAQRAAYEEAADA